MTLECRVPSKVIIRQLQEQHRDSCHYPYKARPLLYLVIVDWKFKDIQSDAISSQAELIKALDFKS